MNRTEYYNLGLPEGADVFNPLSPFNENMEAIADQMHTNEVKTIGQATELKSDTVHSITRVTPDSTFFSFTATSDFTAGDVFTVDGIQVTAKTPTGEALGTGAYVINSQVLCVLVGTLMTVFTSTGKVALASDSEKLGGELPSHYGTAQEVATAVQTAQNANTISLANQQSIIELQGKIDINYVIGVEEVVGNFNNKPIYRKRIRNTERHTTSYTIDSTLTTAYVDTVLEIKPIYLTTDGWMSDNGVQFDGSRYYTLYCQLRNTGVRVLIDNFTVTDTIIEVLYTKA